MASKLVPGQRVRVGILSTRGMDTLVCEDGFRERTAGIRGVVRCAVGGIVDAYLVEHDGPAVRSRDRKALCDVGIYLRREVEPIEETGS